MKPESFYAISLKSKPNVFLYGMDSTPMVPRWTDNLEDAMHFDTFKEADVFYSQFLQPLKCKIEEWIEVDCSQSSAEEDYDRAMGIVQ